MNAKINQLIKQSYVTIQTPSGEESAYFSQEKFAELIVQECADVCERFGESGDGYTCSAEILEHFGVEE